MATSGVIEDIRAALQNNDQASAAAKIKKLLEEREKIPLKIGITGETGAGKSTFVNAFRGVNDQDEMAAPTGFVETTTEVTEYPHPNYPNVTLCDLPGIGSPNFPTDEYLNKVNFQRFDFFIIISDTRFRENDVMLAKEILKKGKKFYFVRSKIDNDLRRVRDSDKQRTLERIRQNCTEGLKKAGMKSPQVFLLSNFELHLYDLHRLQETLERELPEHKREALLLAMPNINLDIIKKKKQAFKANIYQYGLVSAAVAAVPLPGLSVVVDVGIIAHFVNQYKTAFGLDTPSLQRLSDRTGVPLKDLTALMISPVSLNNISPVFIRELLLQSGKAVLSMAAEESLRFIPIFGVLLAAPLSFAFTVTVLQNFLDMLAEDAENVFKKALGVQNSSV